MDKCREDMTVEAKCPDQAICEISARVTGLKVSLPLTPVTAL